MIQRAQWLQRISDPGQVSHLAQTLSITPFLARLLVGRGLQDPSQAHLFLNGNLKDLPDPFLMKGMETAARRIVRAIAAHEKILIYGDYDVDGTTGTSLLLLFFRDIGVTVDFYIPNRLREGYSLQKEALQKIRADGVTLLITVDNGISALSEARFAAELGIDLIITDHHQILPDGLPQALAILNPQQSDCDYPGKEICGTGVAFNLMIALRAILRREGYFADRTEPPLNHYLDLVALATVADVVPLIGVNRIFVKTGLQILGRTQWPGLKALLEVSGLHDDLTASHLGFRLGPRLNACGRLYDASTGVKLLTTRDAAEARRLAGELNAANEERQQIEKLILEEAIDDVEHLPDLQTRLGIVLYRPQWHPGVIGIVASRLVEKYCRPFVVLGTDGTRLKGSARTCGPLNLVETLGDCAAHLLKYGGHRAAAGVTVDPCQHENFSRSFDVAVSKRVTDEDLRPVLKTDAEVEELAELETYYEDISRLSPFGQNNPQPLFQIKGAKPCQSRVLAQKHVKFFLELKGRQVESIAFGRAGDVEGLLNPQNRFVFSIDRNLYQGRSTLQLIIRDFAPL